MNTSILKIILCMTVLTVNFCKANKAEAYTDLDGDEKLNSNLKDYGGLDEFKKLRDNGEFVDKSAFIEEFFNQEREVIVITRPRRFAKSTNLDMLKTFLQIEVDAVGNELELTEKNNFKYFDDLYIKKDIANKIDPKTILVNKYQGNFPVIHVSFHTCKSLTYQKMFDDIVIVIQRAFNEHKYLANSKILLEVERNYVKSFTNPDLILTEKQVKNALHNLCEYLSIHFGKKVFFVVDEYDVPLQTAILDFETEKEKNDLVRLMHHILGDMLKGNKFLERALVVGFMRWSKADFFNNAVVFSVFDEEFSDKFGFTETEVKNLLRRLNKIHLLSAIEEYYEGYEYGGNKIYNPFSLIRYIKQKPNTEPKFHWQFSGNQELLGKIFSLCCVTTLYELMGLIFDTDKSITKVINPEVTINDMKIALSKPTLNDENLFYVLAIYGGYLTPKDVPLLNKFNPNDMSESDGNSEQILCKLKIPNKEIAGYFRDLRLKWYQDALKVTSQEFINIGTAIIKALGNKDYQKIENILKIYYQRLTVYIKEKKIAFQEEGHFQFMFYVFLEHAVTYLNKMELGDYKADGEKKANRYNLYVTIEGSKSTDLTIAELSSEKKRILKGRIDIFLYDHVKRTLTMIESKLAESIKKMDDVLKKGFEQVLDYLSRGIDDPNVERIHACAMVNFLDETKFKGEDYSKEAAEEIFQKRLVQYNITKIIRKT